MLPLRRHPSTWHFQAQPVGEPPPNFVPGASIHITDVDDYDAYRSMLYALGATSVSNRKLAHVDTLVHGAEAPPKAAITKYPQAPRFRAQTVLSLFHQEVSSFGAFIGALQRHGFTVRNPSDEGDPQLDHFELERVDDSLHATLLHYLATSEFARRFAGRTDARFDEVDPAYFEYPIPGTDLCGYIRWNEAAWGRVSAQRGEGDYPLEIKGSQLLAVAPALWTESTGLYFNEQPHIDSVTGLFIQAGIDARSGRVSGTAISRVWT